MRELPEGIENNLLFQKIEEERKIKDLDYLTEYVKEITEIHYDTINNEKEKKHLNLEDDRYFLKSPYIKSTELATNIDGKPYLHLGSCLRKLYFKIKCFKREVKRDLKELHYHEEGVFYKEKVKEMFKFSGILMEDNPTKISSINGVELHAKAEGIIANPVSGKVEVLVIKHINGTAKTVRDNIFRKGGSPLVAHFPELFGIMIAFRLPIKLIYVNKNNIDEMREFNIGFANQHITVNSIPSDKFDFASTLSFISSFKHMFEENYTPDRNYKYFLPENAQELCDHKIINHYDKDMILKGNTTKRSFVCNSCPYKELCDSLGDGTHKER